MEQHCGVTGRQLCCGPVCQRRAFWDQLPIDQVCGNHEVAVEEAGAGGGLLPGQHCDVMVAGKTSETTARATGERRRTLTTSVPVVQLLLVLS